MQDFSIYNLEGRIFMACSPQYDWSFEDQIAAMLASNPDSAGYVLGAYDMDAYYVTDGEVKERPENPATLDGFVIREIPNPSFVWFGSDAYEVLDGEVELDLDPGTYSVVIESFPYKNKEFIVENQSA